MHRLLRHFLLSVLLVLSFSRVLHAETASVGQTITFAVTADGTAPFTYQWYKDSVALSGATSASYVIASASTTHSGSYTVKVTNAAGSVTSTPTVISVVAPVAPSITTHPSSASVTEGGSASLSVAATGTGTLTYQWYKDGAAIAGATASTYSLSSVSMAQGGSYYAKVTNSEGSVSSNAATLTISAAVVAPTISTQPASVSTTTGSAVNFSVTASGTAPFTYQWYKDSVALSGATSSSYAIASAASTHAGSYTVKVTNSAGNVTSNAATLTISAAVVAPTISTQPASVSTTTGSAVNFSVTASGTAPFTYQWYKDSVALSGATSSSYAIASAASTHAGSYTVKVTNSAGNVTSNAATLTISASVVAPTISTQPASVSTTTGSAVNFSVTASGTAPFTYQWYKDSVALSGATSSSYAIASAASTHAGSYTVKVTNSAGNVTSNAASLTVTSAVTSAAITQQPLSTRAAEGSRVTFSVTVSGTDPVSYQWYRNGAMITGAVFSTYSINSVSAGDFGSYKVVAQAGSTTLTSTTASLSSASAQAARITNLSVRSVAGRGGQPLIVGFVSSGASDKQVLVRASGPALGNFGVPGTLADPKMSIYAGSTLLSEVDNWADGGQASSLISAFNRLGAFALTDQASKDSAVLTSINGLRTIHINSARSGESGVVLLEAYDADTQSDSQLYNVSALNYVGTGGEVLVVGFVVTGDTNKNVLIRGVGPSLTSFGVAGALVDPILQLHRMEGSAATLIDTNDDWDSSAQTAATIASSGAFSLPNGSKDSVLVVSLAPGIYTATVSGKSNGTGTAIVELYALE